MPHPLPLHAAAVNQSEDSSEAGSPSDQGGDCIWGARGSEHVGGSIDSEYSNGFWSEAGSGSGSIRSKDASAQTCSDSDQGDGLGVGGLGVVDYDDDDDPPHMPNNGPADIVEDIFEDDMLEVFEPPPAEQEEEATGVSCRSSENPRCSQLTHFGRTHRQRYWERWWRC